MTRKKIELKWIECSSARKSSLRKRREGILKKMNELTTLCGIDGCAVILSPGEEKPLHWPPTKEGVETVMGRFFSLPETEQAKRMTTLESFLGEKIEKLQEIIKKRQRKKKEKEMSELMHQLYSHGRRMEDLNQVELDGLAWFIEEKRRKIEMLRQGHMARRLEASEVVDSIGKGRDFFSDEIINMMSMNSAKNGGVGGGGANRVVSEISFMFKDQPVVCDN